MFEELLERLKKWDKINTELQNVIKQTGEAGTKAILKMRNETPEIYSKYLSLLTKCYDANESVLEERDRLYNLGIDYRKQPSRMEAHIEA